MNELDLEIAYLRWWYQNADFGPADGDVRYYMNLAWKKLGNSLPIGYEDEE